MCLNVADNPETIKLMRASGCKGIFVGFESISKQTITAQRKETVNIVEHYKRQIETLLKHGICVVVAIMFGFDEDTKGALFKETMKVLEDLGVTLLQDLIFTPYPHMECYQILERENRIITKETKYYNGYTVVHKPKHIHPAELQEGVINFRKEFYSWPSTLRRMVKHNVIKMPEFLIWNRLWGRTNLEVIPEVDVQNWLSYLRTL
jgi:radical SAM superfamily enzyme YgiQ (UPF0313 family)